MRQMILAMCICAVGVSVMQARGAGLGKTMEDMEKAAKALQTDTADLTKNEAALKDVSMLETSSLAAKDMVPPKVRKMPDGPDKVKAQADFRKLMGELIKAELDLDAAIVDKDGDAVKKSFGTIGEIMKKGHDTFQD